MKKPEKVPSTSYTRSEYDEAMKLLFPFGTTALIFATIFELWNVISHERNSETAFLFVSGLIVLGLAKTVQVARDEKDPH